MKRKDTNITFDVGVAQTDITPNWPIRLGGFAAREKVETDKVLQPLTAKAIVFGNDIQSPRALIVVEVIGIQKRITNEVAQVLFQKAGILPDHLTILVTHTHGSPEVGNLINGLQCRGDYPEEHYFSNSLLSQEELIHIARFNELLTKKIIEVVLAALKNRKPSLVSWGIGQASFAVNRRIEGGPVDSDLSLLRITDPDGSLRAVLINYACHGITLGPDVNEIHGDWMGDAQEVIEEKYPGVIAFVSIGCAGDVHPKLQGGIEYLKLYSQEILDTIDGILKSELQPLIAPPICKMKWIKLPFAKLPTIAELIKNMGRKDIKGYYSRLALERIIRGERISQSLNYPIQVWNFDNRMMMINMGGEVVVDYSSRLKQKFGSETVWINAYANDVSCYIPSKRILKEGGYEGDTSMYWYNQPYPFLEIIEDEILNTVDELMDME